MSKNNRTMKEYIERYAKSYCNRNTKEAMQHAIVREVDKEIGKEEDEK